MSAPSSIDASVERSLRLVGRQLPLAQEVDVRAHRGQRRAQLVRRVGDESPLAADRLLERGEHRVEARREPAELVAALALDALREVPGRGDTSRRPPSAAGPGGAPPSPTSAASAAAAAMPMPPTSRIQKRMRLSACWVGCSGCTVSTAPAGLPPARTSSRQLTSLNPSCSSSSRRDLPAATACARLRHRDRRLAR